MRPETGVDEEHARPYMVTLCRLTKPVSIKPPRSPQLASFTFFTSRFRQRDGSERLYLHMGYFATLSDAQQWSQRMRTRYPNAIATLAPLALLQQPDSDVPALQTADTQTTPAVQDFPPVRDEQLSDTQVMRILETRRAEEDDNGTDERNGTQVELLRPDDTETRRTLKEAVVEGLPVHFAVQLEWSLQPIDAGRVPLLDIFKGYTLYRAEKRREARSCYFLRLGFFTDAISAKEVACQAGSAFASAAVVPVTEQEFLHADEARIDTSEPAAPLHKAIDEVPSSDRLAAPGLQITTSMVRANSTERSKTASERSSRNSQETLEETLEMLAQREMWTQPDPLSDTSVSHLKVTIEERTAKSAQTRKPAIRFAR